MAGLILLIVFLAILALLILPFVFWILKVIRLSKNEDKTGMWVVLAVGLFLSPLVGWLVGLAFKEDDVDKQRERERERDDFWCGICNIKYQRDFLGGETAYEGKICRSCLGKKQRGEAITSHQSQPKSPSYEPVYHEPRHRFKDERKDISGEKRILLRELSRKQSKKNSYLTWFVVNLVVFQWLMPLTTYFVFWIQIKDKVKVEALNNPGAGLTTEIPFSTLIKDFYKILTSEAYTYGNHKIIISVIWKIGIILAFVFPLIIWIYNLVRYFGAKEETERLETEIKEIES
jgi:hypothetical protein